MKFTIVMLIVIINTFWSIFFSPFPGNKTLFWWIISTILFMSIGGHVIVKEKKDV